MMDWISVPANELLLLPSLGELFGKPAHGL